MHMFVVMFICEICLNQLPCTEMSRTTLKMFHCFILTAYVRFFVNILSETNVNISNELTFSDVYQRVKYNGSQAKFT